MVRARDRELAAMTESWNSFHNAARVRGRYDPPRHPPVGSRPWSVDRQLRTDDSHSTLSEEESYGHLARRTIDADAVGHRCAARGGAVGRRTLPVPQGDLLHDCEAL